MKPQRIPSSWLERESLRVKGQFWTPDWVADAMAAYVLASGADHLLDPAVGAGALFIAAKRIAAQSRRTVALHGNEIDAQAIMQARQNGLSDDDLANLEMRDFVLDPPARRFKAIAANPPYIRHHRLPPDAKAALQKFGKSLIGKPLDGRAGLHIYFLLRALSLLEAGGRLAFIMPADTCEGVFAQTLWHWITQQFRLDAVITFSAAAAPFPNVDTNAIIFLIENSPPLTRFQWAQVDLADRHVLTDWVASAFAKSEGSALTVHERDLNEALATGLSRPPAEAPHEGAMLGEFATVMRGIATGANEFFFLTTIQAQTLHIPDEYLIPAVGRTRDVTSEEVTAATISELERKGRPTLLFAPDGRPLHLFPRPVRDYLNQGETSGIHKRTLIATRRPWYKMESRSAPPFLFAYLGRRNARFIRNTARAIPLTGFLCIYPRLSDAANTERLWHVLKHPDTTANLRLVGKSYGSGAIKVEPRALERLPIPPHVLTAAGLMSLHNGEQLPLLFEEAIL
jgi:adenine-specific DNA-methyltransferase